jgi:hypothetical protein
MEIMNFLTILLYLFRTIVTMSDQSNLESIKRDWALIGTKSVSNKNDELKGYWDFYGMDILTISNDTICTYSFSEETPVSCYQYAYSEKERALNIFTEPEPWQKKINTFSVTLKVDKLDKHELTLLYMISNTENQVYGQLMELHYVAIDDFPVKSDFPSLVEILTSKIWDAEEFTLKFSKVDEVNKEYHCRKKDGGSIFGLWYLHEIGDNKILILKENTGTNKVYQIQKIVEKQILLIQMDTKRELVLSSSS